MILTKRDLRILDDLLSLVYKSNGCSIKDCLVCKEKNRIIEAGEKLINKLKLEKESEKHD